MLNSDKRPGKKCSQQNKWEFAQIVARLRMSLNLPWTHEIVSGALNKTAKNKKVSCAGTAASVLAKVRPSRKVTCGYASLSKDYAIQ